MTELCNANPLFDTAEEEQKAEILHTVCSRGVRFSGRRQELKADHGCMFWAAAKALRLFHFPTGKKQLLNGSAS